MGRTKKWILGKFRIVKFRFYDEKLSRYQQILDAQNKTMQQDMEDHVNKIISGKNN